MKVVDKIEALQYRAIDATGEYLVLWGLLNEARRELLSLEEEVLALRISEEYWQGEAWRLEVEASR